MCPFDSLADESPFFDNDMPTMRSSSSGSEGLPHAIGHSCEGSVESNEVNTQEHSRLTAFVAPHLCWGAAVTQAMHLCPPGLGPEQKEQQLSARKQGPSLKEQESPREQRHGALQWYRKLWDVATR